MPRPCRAVSALYLVSDDTMSAPAPRPAHNAKQRVAMTIGRRVGAIVLPPRIEHVICRVAIFPRNRLGCGASHGETLRVSGSTSSSDAELQR